MSHKRKPRRHNRPWTEFDVARMRKYASDGLSSKEAAKRMGRSRGSVAYKAMTLQVEFHAINQPAGIQRRLARKRKKHGMRATLRRAA